jgi:hypothetical protein
MKTGFKGLFVASTVGLSVALISGCNTEEAPPESVPPPPAAKATTPAETSKTPEVKDAAPAPAPAPAATAPAEGEKKDEPKADEAKKPE